MMLFIEFKSPVNITGSATSPSWSRARCPETHVREDGNWFVFETQTQRGLHTIAVHVTNVAFVQRDYPLAIGPVPGLPPKKAA